MLESHENPMGIALDFDWIPMAIRRSRRGQAIFSARPGNVAVLAFHQGLLL